MMQDTDKIFEQVKLGRGLWIGLFPERCEALAENRMRILAGIERRPDEMPELEDLHITLAHLGKNVSQSFVEKAHAAMEVTAAMHTEMMVNMTGVLRLRKHITIALVPDQVIKLRTSLRGSLNDRQINVDDRFGMTPHMTIAKFGELEQPRVPFIAEKPLLFKGLTMVCGEFACVIPFSEGPF